MVLKEGNERSVAHYFFANDQANEQAWVIYLIGSSKPDKSLENFGIW